ncbi:hypothetical protein [Ulvibacter antarcticus]|uniref:Uncharacterized protein n=1 Tax=Ulvibacter antarcticus TaxID=442714 RepID=A0A3L9Z1S7_9FLAO|nr:hypothetical protein [Ulvibacter antarcticus]RMA64308.1 hypothetical protein BXY75_1181 [Ulvibacter antarcticus]
MKKKPIAFNYPLIVYNELITKAKNKSVIDYEYIMLLTKNNYSIVEINKILETHSLSDIAKGRPELWVLVSETMNSLPSNRYFSFLKKNKLMEPNGNKEIVYKAQLKKAHDYWPRRKRSGKKFR